MRRKGRSEREKPEKISHFYFGRVNKKRYLCRPKSKISSWEKIERIKEKTLVLQGYGGHPRGVHPSLKLRMSKNAMVEKDPAAPRLRRAKVL